MNLQFKLTFPLIAGCIMFVSILHFIWVPLLLSDAQKNYQKNLQLIISSIEPEIIRNLISDDTAALHAFLNSQIQLHLNDWKALEISDNSNSLVYPFSSTDENQYKDGLRNVFHIRHKLEYLGNNLGSLWLVADWSEDEKTISQRFFQLEIYLLGLFGFIIIFSLIWQNLKITKPLTLLIKSVDQLASGDYNSSLPGLGKDEIGSLASAFNNMLDQRRNYEIELENLSQQAQQAFNELTEQKFALDQHAIVTITDVKGTITYANEKFTEISGYSNKELLGKNHRILNSGTHDKGFFIDLYETITNAKVWHGEICNRSKDGHLYWVDSTIAPFMDKDGNPKSYIAIRTDITKRKKAESDLIAAKNIAEDAARIKSEFLASMSHEIRTPMNGVLGMLNLLQNSDMNNEQQHRLAVAKSSATSLLNLINDILDFSKVDAGKMQLELIDFNLRSMLGELAEAMTHQINEKKLELILDTVGIEETMVKGDPGRLRQILVNIISNAVKFTSQGEVVVKVKLVELNERQWVFNCSIRDTGIGIPENKIASLFDSFSQVDSSTTRVYGGSGLGLAIVKKLCKLMDGDVSVISEPDKGSCFEIKVRLLKSHLSQQVLPNIDVKLLTLLIVDDNATNREVLRCQLQHWGVTVVEANSGEQALHLCEQQWLKKDAAFFDIALLDMQMPHMDGAQLGKKIKSDSRFSKMKLIMMTSMGALGDEKYFSELGFSGYFPKPTTTSDLFDALSVVAEDGPAMQKAEPLVTSHYLKTLIHEKPTHQLSIDAHILLVEDNKINQLVAAGLLEEFGLYADIAVNGIQALELLQQAPVDNPYSLVLMDCQMPEMDGYETSRKIRSGASGNRNTNIPIVAMTANAMSGDKEKCLEAGMSDYLSKPIEPEQLLAKLKLWLDSRIETLSSNRSEGVPHKQSNQNAVPVWDQASALKRLLGKADLFKQLLELFFEEQPARLQDLQEAIETDNTKQTILLTHTIKGIAANLGGLHLQEQAKEMELAAKKSDMQQVKALMPGLLKNSEQVHQLFKNYIDSLDSEP